ncbi:MAG TPA: outer membrane insertion C- signal [Bacteroidales bacterium]|nr:outer membrane insertion C- signal [Bacteroidales bacterium]
MHVELLQAQKNYGRYELGLRLGDTYGGSAAVDAMFPLAGNRLHANLSFHHDGLILAGLYDWGFPIAPNFIFYPGVGGIVFIGDDFQLGVAGELGFEYAFNIPLSIGLDWRPVITIIDDGGFSGDGFGLNIRYRF